MIDKQALRADLVAHVGGRLAPLGFAKRRGAVFTVPLDETATGTVGLNVAPGGPEDPLTVNPVVGVRHEPVARLLAELAGPGALAPRYVVPTVSCSLGYLMPQRSYRVWPVGTVDDVPAQMDDMLRAVAGHGIPFMREHSSLEGVIRAVEQQLVPSPDERAVVLAAARTVAGDVDRGRSDLDRYLAEMGSRQDPAAQDVRRRAEALRTYVRAG